MYEIDNDHLNYFEVIGFVKHLNCEDMLNVK